MQLPITGWKKTLNSLGYKVNWKNVWKGSNGRRRKQQNEQGSQYQSLELRRMLADSTGNYSTIQVANGTLEIDLTALELNEVELSTNSVLGNEMVAVNGVTTPFYASQISGIEITGSAEDDRLSLIHI